MADDARRRVAVAKLGELVTRLASGEEWNACAELVGKLAAWMRPDRPTAQLRLGGGEDKAATSRTKVEERNEAAERLFVLWQRETQRSGKFTPDKRAVVLARLREGYSEVQLSTAIRVAARDPFYQGENDRKRRYDDLVTILRNGSRVDKFLEDAGGHELSPPGEEIDPDEQARITELKEDAEHALRTGDVETYNRIQSLLRADQHDRRGVRGEPPAT